MTPEMITAWGVVAAAVASAGAVIASVAIATRTLRAQRALAELERQDAERRRREDLAAEDRRRAQDRVVAQRQRRDEMFREERLAAYLAFYSYARAVHVSGWKRLVGDEKDLPPGVYGTGGDVDVDVGAVRDRCVELTAPIHLLGSRAVSTCTDTAAAAMHAFAIDVAIRATDAILRGGDDPAPAIRALEEAMAADLQGGTVPAEGA